jgi:hypothetical protein
LRLLTLLPACLALLAAPALAQTIALKGPDGRTATIAAADLAGLPRVGFAFEAHGQRRLYEGPLLIDVLARVGTPTGKAIHGPALADAVIVSAADGYQVVFGLGEADPGTRANRIILADRADGAPLDAKDGPYRLVVEGDLRPARGVRGVTSIEVRSLGSAPAAQAHRH